MHVKMCQRPPKKRTGVAGSFFIHGGLKRAVKVNLLIFSI